MTRLASLPALLKKSLKGPAIQPKNPVEIGDAIEVASKRKRDPKPTRSQPTRKRAADSIQRAIAQMGVGRRGEVGIFRAVV